MKIKRLELYTSKLHRLKKFYTQSLQLPLLEETETSFSVAAGTTELCFIAVQDGSKPFYHFAFNIPENKISEAQEWLSSRVKLIPHEDEQIIHFESWNAHSLYFHDPSGNIVEVIARHNLTNSTSEPFDQKQILCLSEIGLPVEEVLEQMEDMQVTLGIQPWRAPHSQFTPLGDEEGLFILVAVGRTWFMSEKEARPYPLHISFHASKNLRINSKQYVFQLMKESHNQ